MKKSLLLILAVMTSFVSNAYDAVIDDLCYNFSGNCAELAHYYGFLYGDFTVPETITYNGATYTVTSIGKTALMHARFKSVTLPNTITNIGEHAFYECDSLISINIPDNVTSIRQAAFSNCDNLASIDISKSITIIDNYAFSGCKSLTSIIIPEGVTSIKYGAFMGCINMASVVIPNSVTSIEDYAFSDCGALKSAPISENVSSIGLYAFSECNALTSVSIPNSVTKISQGAFSRCLGLESITIGSGVTELDYTAFSGCYLKNLINNSTLSNSKNWGAVLYDEDTSDGLLLKNDTVIRCRPWATTVCIPSNIICIGMEAFKDCKDLTFVNMPNSITDIGFGAFDNCGITSITIPNTVINIGDYAFNYCNFASIVIPQNVKEIGTCAFNGCRKLTSVTILCDNVSWMTFSGCVNLTSITLGENVKYIDGNAFWNCRKIKNVYCYATEVPKTGSYLFSQTNLTIYVPASSIDLYKADNKWSRGNNILALPETTVSYTDDQMATIILPTDPDPELGKYYRLNRRQNNLIVFEEEHAPKAHVPYIILPKKDFVIDLSTLDLEGCYRDSVFADGITFIGSFVREEVECAANCYIDIIDLTPDCHEDIFCEKKPIIGALRAFLRVDTHWEDPYNAGGTRSIAKQEKLQIVLLDNNDASAINNITQEETINGKPTDGAIYDLTGRKVNWQLSTGNCQLPKGIYIRNGKRFLVK